MSTPHDFNPTIGTAQTLRPGLRRIVAPNPSAMTFRGTNTYLLGDTEIAVIDPGPVDQAHLAAILQAITPGQQITHIIVTHAHLDHSPLAQPLQAHCGAQIFGYGVAQDGRSDVMVALARAGMVGGGEGIDVEFNPDVKLADGAFINADDWQLEVLHTPGHIGNHICLAWGDHCFTADHVMGWASSLVSPPDGDLTDFMASCERLLKRDWQCFYPGHGDVISAPKDRLNWLIAHRKSREAAILEVLRHTPSDARNIAREIYVDVPDKLLLAAERNVLAHLIDLAQKSLVHAAPALNSEAIFRLK